MYKEKYKVYAFFKECIKNVHMYFFFYPPLIPPQPQLRAHEVRTPTAKSLKWNHLGAFELHMFFDFVLDRFLLRFELHLGRFWVPKLEPKR